MRRRPPSTVGADLFVVACAPALHLGDDNPAAK
jgi:hypothetical protein